MTLFDFREKAPEGAPENITDALELLGVGNKIRLEVDEDDLAANQGVRAFRQLAKEEKETEFGEWRRLLI